MTGAAIHLQTCPLCHEVIAPGDNVVSPQGVLMHLDCYAERLAQANERTQDEKSTPAA